MTNPTKLQIDRVGAFARVSLGELDEAIPGPSSSIVTALDRVLAACGGWQPDQAVLVAHWHDDSSPALSRAVASWKVRRWFFGSSVLVFSEIARRQELAHAIAIGWRLPRLLLLVADSAAEHALASSADGVRDLFEPELPSPLLQIPFAAVIFGFYHQRWISTFAPPTKGLELARDLLTHVPGLREVHDAL